MENITEYVDQLVSKLESIHKDVVYQFSFITTYKFDGFNYIKERKRIDDDYNYIEVPINDAPTGYVNKYTDSYIYLIDFKGVKYYGVDKESYKGHPNIAILFNKTIPETKGIKWTKSIDNIKTYINYVLERYQKCYKLNEIPATNDEAARKYYTYFFTEDNLDSHLDDIKTHISTFYKDKWIAVKKAYIEYEISEKEEQVKGLKKKINGINFDIECCKEDINNLKDLLHKLESK